MRQYFGAARVGVDDRTVAEHSAFASVIRFGSVRLVDLGDDFWDAISKRMSQQFFAFHSIHLESMFRTQIRIQSDGVLIMLFADINATQQAQHCRQIKNCERKEKHEKLDEHEKRRRKKKMRSPPFFVVISCSLNDCYHKLFCFLLPSRVFCSTKAGRRPTTSTAAAAAWRCSVCVGIAHSKDFCGHFLLEHFIFSHFTC